MMPSLKMNVVAAHDKYMSEDGKYLMERRGCNGLWHLVRDGMVLDTDRYRHDLADRYNLVLGA